MVSRGGMDTVVYFRIVVTVSMISDIVVILGLIVVTVSMIIDAVVYFRISCCYCFNDKWRVHQ